MKSLTASNKPIVRNFHMLKIEIHKAELKTFTWQDKKGVTRTGHKQNGYAHLPGKPFPIEISLRVDEPGKVYQPGVYTLSPDSFYIDRFGSICCNPVLVPAVADARKAG
jgi:Helix-destabilising protein